jgi:hypothetical protein
VEFYSGSTLIGTDVSSPYSFVWNSVGAGNYSLTAKATDSVGGVTTSNPVAVSVNTTTLSPTITSFAPTNGPVGAGVYIKGTNFTNVSAVRFNGITATQFYVAGATACMQLYLLCNYR